MSSKQEVLEMINSTIVKNGEKGISAEVLNNVLTEMVEASGEGGSGDGALRLKMIDPMFGFDLFPGEFSRELLEEMLPMMEADMPGISSGDWVKALYSCLEHNAKLYQQLVEKAQKTEGAFVIVDMSETFSAAYKIMGEIAEEDLSGAKTSAAILGEASATTGVEALGMPDTVGIITSAALFGFGFEIILRPDGGFTYELIEDTDTESDQSYRRIYLDGEESITESDKQDNLAFRDDLNNKEVKVFSKPIGFLRKTSSDSYSLDSAYTILCGLYNRFLFLDKSGLKICQCMIDEQGNATITDVSSLTPITN